MTDALQLWNSRMPLDASCCHKWEEWRKWGSGTEREGRRRGSAEIRTAELRSSGVSVICHCLATLTSFTWICTVCFKMFSIFILPSLHFYLRFSPLTTRLKGAQRSALWRESRFNCSRPFCILLYAQIYAKSRTMANQQNIQQSVNA